MSSFILTRATAPATPPAGKIIIYAKADGRMYWKDETGAEYPFRPVGAGSGDLLSDGSIPLTANWDVGPYQLQAETFNSDVPTGTAPFTVASTTMVANLNAALLGGKSLTTIESQYSTAIDLAVAGLYDHKGGYDASTNTPDLDTTPSGILKGDAYTVTVAGTFYAVALEAGDVLIADQDDPTASSHWTIVNRNIDSSAFATSAQGTLADSAVQPGDDVEVLGSGVAPAGQVPVADGVGGVAWAEAAAGGLTPVFITNLDSPYAATAGQMIFCDTSGGNIIINLPAGAEKANVAVSGDATSGTNNITINPNGAETIDNDTSFVIDQNWGQVNSAHDSSNTNWIVALTGIADNFITLEFLTIALGDETTAATTGAAKVTTRIPYNFTITNIQASCNTAPTGGTLLTLDVNVAGASILSTKLTFDASEKTTTTATTPRVISDPTYTAWDEISIDIDAIGNTVAGAGVKVHIVGHQT